MRKNPARKNANGIFGRGIRIRTLNDGVRVRSVTVTLYLYINTSFLTLRKNKWYYTHRS